MEVHRDISCESLKKSPSYSICGGILPVHHVVLAEEKIGPMMALSQGVAVDFTGSCTARLQVGLLMMKQVLAVMVLGVLSGCANYGGYPSYPGGGYGGGYGYPSYPPTVYGYGGYPVPAYGYYPGPVYYGRPYGGYGYSEHESHRPITNDQRALNYLYDHRNQFKHLPPQQQREVLREANKIMQHNTSERHHHHSD